MKQLLATILIGTLATGATGATSLANAQDAPTSDKTAAEIRSCSRANLPEKSMVQAVEMAISERSGNTREIGAFIFIKRFGDEETRGTLQVNMPADVKGVSYLWIDTGGNDQLSLYLPSLQRVRRVTGKTAANSLLGSDFSYEDIKYLRGTTAGGSDKKLASGEVAQRGVYRLQITPAPAEESTYKRVLFYIDQETCVPLQIEFFAEGESPRKRLTADVSSLQKIGGRWFARRLNMHDLGDDTQTKLTVTGVEYDENVNDAIFNQRGFFLSAYVPKTDISSDLETTAVTKPGSENPK